MLDLGIYVHIPFCESKCTYCNFISSNQDLATIKKYFDCLLNEIEKSAPRYADYCVKTIYIGGGTPSFVNEKHIESVLQKIRKYYVVDKHAEISIECNPNSLTKQKAYVYKNIGINRVSVGLQVANDKLLKQLNRPHNTNDFIKAINALNAAGFDNINADIMVGIPNQSVTDIKRSLKIIHKLKINHVSAYALMLEEGTQIFQQIEKSELKTLTEEKSLKMYDYIYKYLNKKSIYRYEVSNFAKIGKECKHNIIYWENGDYLGFGLSSHSKIGKERFSNTENLKQYMNHNIVEKHSLTTEEEREEMIMLSLRMKSGLNITNYNEKFHCDFLKEKEEIISNLLNLGLIRLNFCYKNDNKQIFLCATNAGFSVLNSIINKLI